jgi:hypothetical protein
VTRAAAVLGVSLWGCAASQALVRPEEAARLQRELAGAHLFLAVSMYVTPFFDDGRLALLTPWPPDEVRWLEAPDGTPIEPGPVERTVPVGTPVLVERVEFPSATTRATRSQSTPRGLIWVFLQVRGLPRPGHPLVLLLRPGLRSASEVQAELERSLTPLDPGRRLAAWPETVREAVRTKKAILEMPAEALEMAWGLPERKRLELAGSERQEIWSWPGHRSATVIDGRVTALPPEVPR